MSAQYIIRLDDACPTMCNVSWDALETMLDQHGVCPVVGVIPDNQDTSMFCDQADLDFWGRVRRWEAKGWNIALHGLHHVQHSIHSDQRGLIPLHCQSEFVGLTLEEQRTIIKKSWKIFIENGVRPKVFMAPSHSFDTLTLEALRLETDIRIITDGYALYPFKQDEFVWVPQQLWRFRHLPIGVWTVCFHPNTMDQADVKATAAAISSFSRYITSLDEVIKISTHDRSFIDHFFAYIFTQALKVRKIVSSNLIRTLINRLQSVFRHH